MAPRLVRARNDRFIAGVCAGVARRLGLDPFQVRLAAVVAGFFSFGVAAAVYVVLWIALPTDAAVPPARMRR